MSIKKNFYKKYDNSTKTKLNIFEQYFQEAIPVFIKSQYFHKITVVDFFAGKGKDELGVFGTPLIILNAIKYYCSEFDNSKNEIKIILNDYKESDVLSTSVADFIENCKLNCQLDNKCILLKNNIIEITNKEFIELFSELYSSMNNNNPKILFFDPFNFQFNKELFLKLIDLPRTDFLLFIPSSYLKRFPEDANFNKLSISIDEIKQTSADQLHRLVFQKLSEMLPSNKEYYLAPFSLQKNSNYYGLIFGTSHTYGIEKFLKICWKIDKLTGEADYNIDSEPSFNGKTLFDDMNTSKKVNQFNDILKNKILEKEIHTNYEAYIFGLKEGFNLEKVSYVIKLLISENKIKEIRTLNQKIHELKNKQEEFEII